MSSMQKSLRLCALVLAALSPSYLAFGQAVPDVIVPIFGGEVIQYDDSIAEGAQRGGHRVFKSGQQIEATVDLPAAPGNQRDAKRILATLIIEPIVVNESSKLRPGDPWTRVGTLTALAPPASGAKALNAQKGRSDAPNPERAAQNSDVPASSTEPVEIELMRVITSFGGSATYTQDLTALAPILSGKATLRLFIGTHMKPGWNITLTLTYTTEGAGYRRPIWAHQLFRQDRVTAQNNTIQVSLDVPPGLARPRLQILSTGHASDGAGGDEFITRTHILRIDGREVARWRPWTEEGGALRPGNPMSGRDVIDGRELWSSDLDRSGWSPGLAVQPLRFSAPELIPGHHTIELEIVDIRPKDAKGFGYWRESAIAVADEPWPVEDQGKVGTGKSEQTNR